MNRFCITGEIALATRWWMAYWKEVERGILGLNPKELFRKDYVN